MQLRCDELAHLLGIEQEIIDIRCAVRLRQSQREAVVRVNHLNLEVEALLHPRSGGERPRGVHPSTEWRQHRESPIAKLVAAKNKDIKRVAVLARNDLFPLAVAQEFEKAVKAEGMEVVASERYAIGTMDHSAAITQMRAARPDWFYASGYINDLILIRKQMADLGLRAPIITCSITFS